MAFTATQGVEYNQHTLVRVSYGTIACRFPAQAAHEQTFSRRGLRVFKLPQRPSSKQVDATDELLHTLLQAPAPTQTPELRPVALRSTAEQRRVALRAFLVRTWLDRALHLVERGLVLALVGFLATGWRMAMAGTGCTPSSSARQRCCHPMQWRRPSMVRC